MQLIPGNRSTSSRCRQPKTEQRHYDQVPTSTVSPPPSEAREYGGYETSRCNHATMWLSDNNLQGYYPCVQKRCISDTRAALSANCSGCCPAGAFKKLKTEPHNYITKALGAEKLQPKITIRVTRIREFQRNGSTVERIDCVIYPQAKQCPDVLRRSGMNRVLSTVRRNELTKWYLCNETPLYFKLTRKARI